MVHLFAMIELRNKNNGFFVKNNQSNKNNNLDCLQCVLLQLPRATLHDDSKKRGGNKFREKTTNKPF
jgi:hypothetical protein